MREVEHVHEPVDEAQSAGDEEVQGAEADAGDEGEDEGAHSWTSVRSRLRCVPRRLGVHAEQPAGEVVVVEELAG